MLTHQLFLPPEINVTRGTPGTVQTQITSDKAHELLSEGLRKYLQLGTFITQIFLCIIADQGRALAQCGDQQEAGGGDGREREREIVTTQW